MKFWQKPAGFSAKISFRHSFEKQTDWDAGYEVYITARLTDTVQDQFDAVLQVFEITEEFS